MGGGGKSVAAGVCEGLLAVHVRNMRVWEGEERGRGWRAGLPVLQ